MAKIESLEIKLHVFTTEKLEQAFSAWFEDYNNDKDSFVDYDSGEYGSDDYGRKSAEALIKYLNKEVASE